MVYLFYTTPNKSKADYLEKLDKKFEKHNCILTEFKKCYTIFTLFEESESANMFFFFFSSEEQPVIRIKKIVIENFKSVKHGEITFNCGREFIPHGTKADILGLYGQNGSGKTSLIEALSILKYLLTGKKVPGVYSECISQNSERAKLLFEFELQYEDETIRCVEYSFDLTSEELGEDAFNDEDDSRNKEHTIIHIENEKLRIDCKPNGDASRMQVMMDCSMQKGPFGPAEKIKYFVSNDEEEILNLMVNKKLAYERSCSYVFMSETQKIIEDKSNDSLYSKILKCLKAYGLIYLHVVDTKATGLINLKAGFPLYTREGIAILSSNKPIRILEDSYKIIKNHMESINLVLQQLIPELEVGTHEISDFSDNKGKGYVVEFIARRNGVEMPLCYESDGVRKIISILCLLIMAYNNESTTVAIDEFDAGVFEYLLGEILEIFQESGKGQFIFTSHNLRPLEVIDKKYICFTTTDAENRYYRMKYVGNSNNLRDFYLREILLNNTQEVEVYKRTKAYKIVNALREAGEKEWPENPAEKNE